MSRLLSGRPRTRPLQERFSEKYVVSDDGCWNWTSTRFIGGYGSIWKDGTNRLAHRISYLLFKGDPGDQCVLHRCDNRKCVNPEHLFLGSRTDNHNDMVSKGRMIIPNGNKLTPADVSYIRSCGENQPTLAKRFGVSQVMISRIRLRRCWKKVA